MWYRKDFKVPSDWRGQHVLLHFGAVDQIATVWVNNRQVAYHEGGYTEFSADITSALRSSGPQELTCGSRTATKPTPFPVGKQRNDPGGLFYTGASGIWQTVWMEPVPRRTRRQARHHPGPDEFHCHTKGFRDDGTRRAEVIVSKPGGDEVARASGKPGQPLRIPVPNPRLWTPDDPYLYDLKVRLVSPPGRWSTRFPAMPGCARSALSRTRRAGRESR